MEKTKCKLCGEKLGWGGVSREDRDFALIVEICVECWNKPFEITSVCRGDVFADVSRLNLKQFAGLTDDDMYNIADKMAEAYCENSFHEDLDIIARSILDEKK